MGRCRDRELKLKDLLDSIALTLQRRDVVRQNLDELHEKEIIREMLQKKPYLLIIDNLEIKPDDRLRRFLLELPDPSKTLITSRSKLELVKEGPSISLQGLRETEALDLIKQAGSRIGLQKLVDSEDKALLQIVQATGGAPLAIKWVIGQMKQKGQSLDSVLRSIRAARGDLFDDIVKGSWDLLYDGAKKVLRVLALFVGSASRSAVEAGSNIRDFELDDAIGQLVEMSLTDATQELDSSSQRFSIHPLTRNFVLEGPGRDSEEMENEARGCIANYNLSLVTRYFPRTSNISDTDEYKGVSRLTKYRAFVEQGDSQNQRPDYSQLEVDMENILSSVDWCFGNQKNEMLIDFSLILTVFFELQGHAEESIRHGENAIQRAKAQNDKVG